MNRHDPNDKNTINWQQSIQKRKQLIDKACNLGLILENPHNMKLGELLSLVDNAERWVRR